MSTRIMIVASRNDWYCISCRLVNKHTVSIDQHLQTCHLHLLSPASASSPFSSKYGQGSVSDGELDYFADVNLLYGKTAGKELSDTLREVHRSSFLEMIAKKKGEVEISQSKSETGDTSSSLGTDVSTSEPPQTVFTSCQTRMGRLKARQKQLQTKPDERHHSISDATNKIDRITRKKKLQTKEKQNHPRKRQRRISDSSDEELKEDDDCTVKGQTIQYKKFQLSTDESSIKTKEDTDNENSNRMARSDVKGPVTTRNKYARTQSVLFKKIHDREVRRPGLGGKPVCRTQDIPQAEKTEFKMRYVSFEDMKHSNSSTPVLVSQGENITNNTNRPVSLIYHRESLQNTVNSNANKNRSEPPTTDELDELQRADIVASGEKPADRLVATENRLSACDGMKNNGTNSLMSSFPENLQRAKCRTNLNVKEVQGTGITVTELYKSENHDSCQQSSTLLPDLGDHVYVPQVCHIFRQPVISDVSFRGYAHVSSASTVNHKGLHPNGNCDSVPSLDNSVTNPKHLLHKLDDASSHSDADDLNLSNSSRGENRYNQKRDIVEIMQNKQPESFPHLQTPDSEDLVKNKTNFCFAKTSFSASFGQPSEIHKCTVCLAEFSDARFLSDHLQQKSRHSSSQCKVCLQSFHSVYDLNLHVFGHHERKSNPFCFDCGGSFQSMETFEKHLHQHLCVQDLKLLDMEYHCCQICKCDLLCNFDTLRKHYHNKHKVTVCLECFVRSNLVLMFDAASVKEHREVHANFCNICIQDLSSAESLQTHRLSHIDMQYEEDGHGKLCDRCNQWCPNKGLALLHHKEHRLQTMRNWRVEKWGTGVACLYCDKILRNKRNLQRHVAQLHSSSRSYKFHCEFCGKGVDSRSSLKDHIALHHLGIKRYMCEFCHERFACAPTLRRHVLREHAKDKQYTCEVCGEKFCEKFSLTKHMYVHTGSARFMCEQCGKGFHSSSEFKKHLSVHAEIREFVCQGCGQSYKRKEHLKRHIQKCTKAVDKDE